MKFKIDTKEKLGIKNGTIIEDSNLESFCMKVKKYILEHNKSLGGDRETNEHIFEIMEIENDNGKKVTHNDYWGQSMFDRRQSEFDPRDIIDPKSEEGKKILEKARLNRE